MGGPLVTHIQGGHPLRSVMSWKRLEWGVPIIAKMLLGFFVGILAGAWFGWGVVDGSGGEIELFVPVMLFSGALGAVIGALHDISTSDV